MLALALWLHATIPDPTFAETTVLDGIPTITGLGRAPDGSNRMFVIQKQGTVQVIEDGVLSATPFATLSPIITAVECGLIGMTFDPDFASNHFVYFFVTTSTTEQQIQRFTDVDGIGTNRHVVIGGLPTRGLNHDGGGLGFGADGKLYWSIGDQGDTRTGADGDLLSLAAKIGRANHDGSAPTDNPFYDGPGPNNDYIWARGFRNPFTMTFHPVTGKLHSNVVGNAYEQVLVIGAGEHAGWDNFEANQQPGFVPPIMVYPTNFDDVWTVTSVARAGGIATVDTAETHRFRHGHTVTFSGVADPSMNGPFVVAEWLANRRFTIVQAGPDMTSSGGTVTSPSFGGAITGGTFYDSTSFAEPDHLAFFVGDYNTGNLMRGRYGADGRVESFGLFGTNFGATVDAEIAANGALWIGELGGTIFQIDAAPIEQSLIVTPTNLRAIEGGNAAITVRLSMAPSAPVVVLAAESGDPDIVVTSGRSLTFGPNDWDRPQPVLLSVGLDPDATADTATITVTSAGLAPREVVVRVLDQPRVLILSSTRLGIIEGTTASYTVALSSPPADAVTVTATTAHRDLTITAGSILTFGPTDYAIPQTVSIEALGDPDELNEAAAITVGASAAPSASVLVRIYDDDVPGFDAGLEPDATTIDADSADAIGGADADGTIAADSGTADIAPTDASTTTDGAIVAPETDEGCGCAATNVAHAPVEWMLLLLGATALRRARAGCRHARRGGLSKPTAQPS